MKMPNTSCQRCKHPFICNPTNIAACNCSKIQLTAEEIAYIAKQYTDCICNTCLLYLKEEFRTLNN